MVHWQRCGGDCTRSRLIWQALWMGSLRSRGSKTPLWPPLPAPLFTKKPIPDHAGMMINKLQGIMRKQGQVETAKSWEEATAAGGTHSHLMGILVHQPSSSLISMINMSAVAVDRSLSHPRPEEFISASLDQIQTLRDCARRFEVPDPHLLCSAQH
jgi:hypothetical protein